MAVLPCFAADAPPLDRGEQREGDPQDDGGRAAEDADGDGGADHDEVQDILQHLGLDGLVLRHDGPPYFTLSVDLQAEPGGTRVTWEQVFDDAATARAVRTIVEPANEQNLDWYVGWLADSMVHSFIARRDLDTEMTVVRNEMEMGENNAGRILFERVMSTAYQWHNYGKSTIGARSDVEGVNIERLQNFYRTYYRPANATVIVTGKFDPAKVRQWIAAAFGPLQNPKTELPPLYTLDPAQDGEKSITVRRVGGSPSLYALYHVPPGAHPDYAAISALNLILGDTPSGRLHQRVVEKQLAAGAFSFSQGLQDPGFTLLGVSLAPGQDLDKARQAWRCAGGRCRGRCTRRCWRRPAVRRCSGRWRGRRGGRRRPRPARRARSPRTRRAACGCAPRSRARNAAASA
mgnify:CR=1 FL=1